MQKLMYYPIEVNNMVYIHDTLRKLRRRVSEALELFRDDCNVCVVKETSTNSFIVSNRNTTINISKERMLQMLKEYDLVVISPEEGVLASLSESFKMVDVESNVRPSIDQ